MGACTSKTKKNKEKYLKNDVTNGDDNNKKDSNSEQVQRQSLSANVDKFANVPFIDSDEKLTTTSASSPPPPPPPLSTEQESIPTNHDHDNNERTTVKTNFETNVSYSSIETIEKLKQEVYTFLREKILPIKEEKQKLIDYVHKRIIGNTTETAIIDESLEECFNDIEKQQHPDNDINNKIKRRLMNIVTIYVSSQSSDNSFLKALYDKMGPSLDLNSLNAETNEHEVVNVTVTKTVRQVFVDGSSSLIPNSNLNSTTELPNSVIHISNNEHHIPADLPDDIRHQEQSYSSDKQTTIEDENVQDEYSINDPHANSAATKIQAQFRGHRARQDFKKIKQGSKQSSESDFEPPATPNDEHQKVSFDKQESTEEFTEEEKREQERAAIAIQAQFRGFQVRKNRHGTSNNKNQQKQDIDKDSNEISRSTSTDFNENDKIDVGENNDIDQLQFEKQSTQLGETLENDTEISHNSSFDQEVQPETLYNEIDMNDPTLDKAATRIQASFRGYKTRKELGSSSLGNYSHTGHDQQHSSPISSPTHDEYDNTHNKNILSPSAEGNKVPVNENDDYAAAVKIQAAYRGYRVRKELEK